MLSKDQIITHDCTLGKSRFSSVVLGLLTVGGHLCVALQHEDLGVTVSVRRSDDRRIRAVDFWLLLGPVPQDLSIPGIQSLLPGGQPQWARDPRDCCVHPGWPPPPFGLSGKSAALGLESHLALRLSVPHPTSGQPTLGAELSSPKESLWLHLLPWLRGKGEWEGTFFALVSESLGLANKKYKTPH